MSSLPKRIYGLVLLMLAFVALDNNAAIPCFFVEGVTGVGKTTFVQLLSKNLPDVEIVYEPVDMFTNVNGAGNILELFFGNQKRWTFTTECYAAIMHAKALEDKAKTTKKKILLVDRCSIYADCFAFGKMALQSGNMSLIEWEVYKQQVDWISKNTTVKPYGFIYLYANPEIAMERVKQRNRNGEGGVSIEYQQQLGACYHEWFVEKNNIPQELASIPVLFIDATQNFKVDPEIQYQLVKQVENFIAKLTTNAS